MWVSIFFGLGCRLRILSSWLTYGFTGAGARRVQELGCDTLLFPSAVSTSAVPTYIASNASETDLSTGPTSISHCSRTRVTLRRPDICVPPVVTWWLDTGVGLQTLYEVSGTRVVGISVFPTSALPQYVWMETTTLNEVSAAVEL